jgi:predicted amidophosphoribosyltransferase
LDDGGTVSPQLCVACNQEWAGIPRRSIIAEAEDIPHLYVANYSTSVRSVILRAKEENDRMARRILAVAITRCLGELRIGTNYSLAAIPSSKAANRIRGFQHGELLVQAVARANSLRFDRGALIEIRRVRDQAGLTALQRETNIALSFAVSPATISSRVKLRKSGETGNIEGGVVVVDDVVTTGSSMREALRALRAADIPVLALISAVGSSRFSGAVQSKSAIR